MGVLLVTERHRRAPDGWLDRRGYRLRWTRQLAERLPTSTAQLLDLALAAHATGIPLGTATGPLWNPNPGRARRRLVWLTRRRGGSTSIKSHPRKRYRDASSLRLKASGRRRSPTAATDNGQDAEAESKTTRPRDDEPSGGASPPQPPNRKAAMFRAHFRSRNRCPEQSAAATPGAVVELRCRLEREAGSAIGAAQLTSCLIATADWLDQSPARAAGVVLRHARETNQRLATSIGAYASQAQRLSAVGAGGPRNRAALTHWRLYHGDHSGPKRRIRSAGSASARLLTALSSQHPSREAEDLWLTVVGHAAEQVGDDEGRAAGTVLSYAQRCQRSLAAAVADYSDAAQRVHAAQVDGFRVAYPARLAAAWLYRQHPGEAPPPPPQSATRPKSTHEPLPGH